MARRSEPLTVRIFINGEERSQFTPEEMERAMKRMGQVMSEYYRLHPEEYEDLCRRDDAKKAAAKAAEKANPA